MFLASAQYEKIPLDGLPRLPWILIEASLVVAPFRPATLAAVETRRNRPLVWIAADSGDLRIVTACGTSPALAPADAPFRMLFGWSAIERALEILEPRRFFVTCDPPDTTEPTRLVLGGEIAMTVRRVAIMRDRPTVADPLPPDALRPLAPVC